MAVEKAEDTLSVSNFNNICRMCLVSGASKPLFLSEDEDSASVLEFLKNCVSVEVGPEDGLPEYICKTCASQALRLQNFIEKCREADKRLRLAIATIADNDLNEIGVCEIAFSDCEEPMKVELVTAKPKTRTKPRLRIMYPCKICGREFNKNTLRNHMRSHTKEKPFVCRVCKRGFSIPTNLRRHMMTHTGERPNVCNICGKGFIQLTSLVAHLKTHGPDREKDIAPPYSCLHCGRSFLRLGCFNTHVLQHQKPKDREKDEVPVKKKNKPPQEHKCEMCMRVYKAKCQLKQHMVTHSEKCFLCSECGKGFFTKYSLEIHRRVHTGEKPYSCTICNKSFANFASSEKHSRTHTGEKPYQCELCPRAFSQGGHLTYHKRTHSGERPYSCSFCDKAFALKSNLTVHVRTHTGEKPHLCPVCGKGFYDSSSMKKHHRGHDRDT